MQDVKQRVALSSIVASAALTLAKGAVTIPSNDIGVRLG